MLPLETIVQKEKPKKLDSFLSNISHEKHHISIDFIDTFCKVRPQITGTLNESVLFPDS